MAPGMDALASREATHHRGDSWTHFMWDWGFGRSPDRSVASSTAPSPAASLHNGNSFIASSSSMPTSGVTPIASPDASMHGGALFSETDCQQMNATRSQFLSISTTNNDNTRQHQMPAMGQAALCDERAGQGAAAALARVIGGGSTPTSVHGGHLFTPEPGAKSQETQLCDSASA